MMETLEQELKTFDAHRDELLGAALNKYVLIHGTEISGTFDTESDAIDQGYRQFGNVPFLVKRVTAVDDPANFLSGLITI